MQLELWREETAVMSHERRSFKAMIEIAPKTVRVLVTEPEGDVMKAEFRSYPGYTRALLFILKALTLWSGQRLCVAMGAFGGGEWPKQSALVEFVFVETDGRRRRKPSGVGDFRKLRRRDAQS